MSASGSSTDFGSRPAGLRATPVIGWPGGSRQETPLRQPEAVGLPHEMECTLREPEAD